MSGANGNKLHPLVIHLVLTHHWFDEMAAGRKDVEYRAVTPHWTRLIWDRRDRITHARFSRGYTSNTIERPVLFVSRGKCPYNGWDGEYYRLHLDYFDEDNRVICGKFSAISNIKWVNIEKERDDE